MQELLSQLAHLFLGALPTAILVFFLYFFLRWGLWRPLERVLAERQAATEGARKQAEEMVSRAAERLREYEEALRQARAEVYREQEASRQAALEERSRLLRETRAGVQDSLRQAKLEIARDVEQARTQLDAESERLAEKISQALLAVPAARSGDRRR